MERTIRIRILQFLFFALLLPPVAALATTHHVGPGQPFSNPTQAAAVTEAGDTILIHPGLYDRTYFIEDLNGTSSDWIVIRGIGDLETVLGGGTESLHFINGSYIILENLVFERNTGNGVNIDDGGDYTTPTHHFILRDCVFRNMNASGNNDFLKLSGLDSFEVTNCLFMDGAAGGSGIDMVGCHWGLITNNSFYRLGSNSIQAKGGTRYITITRNYFEDGGLRAMNLGGSTGLAFFRPLGVNYEARDLEVHANVTVGSDAPVAYVSSQNVRVWNNTFYLPDRWVLRILQESGDTSFFLPASYGEFINNLIVVDNDLRSTANIGPLTRPETFLFSNNLWWHLDNPGFAPTIPTPDPAGITGMDPMLADPQSGDFSLLPGSPAIGKGRALFRKFPDHRGQEYASPPSIGSFEGSISTANRDIRPIGSVILYPNPASQHLSWDASVQDGFKSLILYDLMGQAVFRTDQYIPMIDISGLQSGTYHWIAAFRDQFNQGMLVIVR